MRNKFSAYQVVSVVVVLVVCRHYHQHASLVVGPVTSVAHMVVRGDEPECLAVTHLLKPMPSPKNQRFVAFSIVYLSKYVNAFRTG